MTKQIPLSRGLVALVDDEDFDWLSKWKWYATPGASLQPKYYVVRAQRTGDRYHTVYMHREVLGITGNKLLFADHIDRDPLNNQRANLRSCTLQQNNINRVYQTPASGYRGVYIERGRYRATLEVEGVALRVGALASAELAARVYDALAREFHGEFAVLNFPDRKVA